MADRVDHILRVPGFACFDWVEHGFATRHTSGWPDASRLATARQVHSATVLTALEGGGPVGTGDALITNRPGLLVGVRTADCVPILLIDPRNRAVAAIHAGWRGTAQEIAGCTISALIARFGTVPEELHAAIGPAIGVCCYEVGPDVASRFVAWIPELAEISGPAKLDLREVNRKQLAEAGLRQENVFHEAPCTFCSGHRFHSFRRDGEKAGRMIACIGIRGD